MSQNFPISLLKSHATLPDEQMILDRLKGLLQPDLPSGTATNSAQNQDVSTNPINDNQDESSMNGSSQDETNTDALEVEDSSS